MENFFLAFIPIFVAVDPVGLLPIFIALTQSLDKSTKRRVIGETMLTATCLSIGFIFLGRVIFKILGVTMGDFMIAGGLVLFCIAVMDLLSSGKDNYISSTDLGAVPLGTPLLVGPAVLTTSIIMLTQYGMSATIASILINILLVGVIFLFSDSLIKLIGEGGARALSKVMALLLAAIAVMMIRKGISQVIQLF